MCFFDVTGLLLRKAVKLKKPNQNVNLLPSLTSVLHCESVNENM